MTTHPILCKLLTHTTSGPPVVQAPVVQTLDSAIHRIKIYPVDSAIGFRNTYPVESAIQRLNNRGQVDKNAKQNDAILSAILTEQAWSSLTRKT